MIGVGVLLLFFGVSMNAARVVRPLAAVLGAPARAIGGAPGILARDNATRNPARTASTASALMIGLALVTFVAIFGQGVFKSFEDAVDQLFVADYAITATNTFTPDRRRCRQVARRQARCQRRDADSRRLSPFPRQRPRPHGRRSRTSRPGSASTGRRAATRFPAGSARTASSPTATTRRASTCSIGSPVSLEFPSGKRVNVRLIGIYDQPNGGSPFGDATISTTLFDKYIPRPRDEMVLVNTPDGVSDANTADARGRRLGVRRREGADPRRVQDELHQARSRRSSTCSTHCSRSP